MAGYSAFSIEERDKEQARLEAKLQRLEADIRTPGRLVFDRELKDACDEADCLRELLPTP